MRKNGRPPVKKPRITEEKPNVDWGLYMWRLPNGKLFHDGDGNYLNIPSIRGDLTKMAAIREAAAYYGQSEGSVHFEPGVERRTDEEYSEQLDMMQAGEIHDRDYGAIMDDRRSRLAHE